MENLTGGTPPVRYLPCVVPCKLYFTVLQTLVVAIGAGLGVWGVVNLMEGYGNDNPGANAHVR